MKKQQSKGPTKAQIGTLGENIACRFISQQGYSVMERNYRKKYGEIDIIATTTDGTLHFFEVKAGLLPKKEEEKYDWYLLEEKVTKAKLRKWRKTALVFCEEKNKEQGVVGISDGNFQFHILAIAISRNYRSFSAKVLKNIVI